MAPTPDSGNLLRPDVPAPLINGPVSITVHNRSIRMDHWQPETMSRARSLRQRFADSRSSASSSMAAAYATPAPTARWQSQHAAKMALDGLNCAGGRLQAQQQSSTESETMAAPSTCSSPRMSVRPAGSKSPSPSRAALAPGAKPDKRPTSVSWMVVSPRGVGPSRPGTPSAGYPLDVSASASAVPCHAACHHGHQSDDRAQLVSDCLREHSNVRSAKVLIAVVPIVGLSAHLTLTLRRQVNVDGRGVLAAFKSKSLDLLGGSRILHSHAQRHAGRAGAGDEHAPGRSAAAERRRRLFRRKKANSASGSYDDSPSGSPQSRSSSLESNSATHAIHRGLESALKASTLFAWSSVEASTCAGHLLQHANQPSFIERESRLLPSPLLPLPTARWPRVARFTASRLLDDARGKRAGP